MKNKMIWTLAVLFYMFFCLSGCGSTKEEQLLLLEEGIPTESQEAQGQNDSSGTAQAQTSGAGETTQGLLEDTSDVQEPSVIAVHVCGAVAAPGVYELEVPVRIVDAIAAAGGFDGDAAESYLNQAAFLKDGQQVYVPTKDEADQTIQLSAGVDSGSVQTAALNEAAEGVNINTAAKAELMTLPGIGEAKAENIIRYREASGGFCTIEDIMQVEGIKEGLFRKIKEQICIGP
ncbi:MAG: helix-hairpin-helix domain-containing protein [Lachnospiraceae bacterium]